MATVARRVYGPEASWRHVMIDLAAQMATALGLYGALRALGLSEEGALLGVVVAATLAVAGYATVVHRRSTRRHRAHMMNLTREAIRRKAHVDAAAGRSLGTMDDTRNWLLLRGVEGPDAESLLEDYAEAYDEAIGRGGGE